MASTAPVRAWNSRTSAPEQKARPSPVTTSALTSPSRSACFTASARARRSGSLTAFMLSGRLRRSQATPFSTWYLSTCCVAASVIASPSLELAGPLLQEGAHSLLLVLRREEEVEVLPFDREALPERGLQRLVHRLLGHPHGQRGLRRQLPRQLDGD